MMKIEPIRTDLHAPGEAEAEAEAKAKEEPKDDAKTTKTVPVGLLDTLSRTVKIAASRLTQDQPSSASGTRK
jgi:hypothetical protein